MVVASICLSNVSAGCLHHHDAKPSLFRKIDVQTRVKAPLNQLFSAGRAEPSSGDFGRRSIPFQTGSKDGLGLVAMNNNARHVRPENKKATRARGEKSCPGTESGMDKSVKASWSLDAADSNAIDGLLNPRPWLRHAGASDFWSRETRHSLAPGE